MRVLNLSVADCVSSAGNAAVVILYVLIAKFFRGFEAFMVTI